MSTKQLVLTGIAIPLVVGIALLLLEHKVIAPDPVVKPVATQIEQTKISSGASVSRPTPVLQKASTTPAPSADVSTKEKLIAQISLVDQIYGVDPRNAEYSKIIDRALLSNEREIAVSIADKLYGVDARNANYGKIINHVIAQNQLDAASELISKLYGVDSRNAALKQLLEARSK